MTAGEYAKVHAILEKIEGLRRAMIITAIVGAAVSTFSFVYTGLRIEGKTGFFVIDYTANTLATALLFSIFLYLPVILILGFFSNRVNSLLEQLANGRYERTIVVPFVIPDQIGAEQKERK